ncbi:hypothetical protein ABPG74_005974 [Tetrahymena malaccensis]
MSLTLQQNFLVETIVLFLIQILFEIISYQSYKKKVDKKKHSYGQYLNYCFIQSIFFEKVDKIIKSQNIYPISEIQKLQMSEQSFFQYSQNEKEAHKDVQIENIEDSMEELLNQDQNTNKNQVNLNNRNEIQFDSRDESKKKILNHGKLLFYTFYFALVICLPISLIKNAFSLIEEKYYGQDYVNDINAINIFIRIFTDVENLFDYFCFLFAALMIQNQGIFIKLIQDQYQNGKSNDLILSRYYNNFYQRYFNFKDLYNEFQQNIIQNSKPYQVKDEFKMFLNSKMHLCLLDLDIKQKQLEHNHEFKDFVYNQGIFQQLMIKLLYFYFTIIMPIFLFTNLFKFLLSIDKANYGLNIEQAQNIRDFLKTYQVKEAQTAISNFFYTFSQIYSFCCYLILIILKYFVKQQVFLNKTEYGKVN